MKTERVVRTYLAAPAHRRRLLESAARSDADAVFLDLEDAVPEAEKNAALLAACAALAELDWGSKTVSVRINACGSPTQRAEISALSQIARLDAIIVPKAENATDIAEIAAWLQEGESLAGRGAIDIELLIETARGLVMVEQLASCHERVAALHLGVGDFAASIGVRSSEIGGSPASYRQTSLVDGRYVSTPLDIFSYPMMRVLVAARAFGLRAIDGPCGAFQDLEFTRAWAEKAAAMGFDGKQVIHPTQIAATRVAFIPGQAEQEFAARVVSAMEQAETDGKGAVSVDGKMIDLANVRMARRILRLAGTP